MIDGQYGMVPVSEVDLLQGVLRQEARQEDHGSSIILNERKKWQCPHRSIVDLLFSNLVFRIIKGIRDPQQAVLYGTKGARINGRMSHPTQQYYPTQPNESHTIKHSQQTQI